MASSYPLPKSPLKTVTEWVGCRSKRYHSVIGNGPLRTSFIPSFKIGSTAAIDMISNATVVDS